MAPQLFPHVLFDRWAERRDEIQVVTGHFPLCTIEFLDAEFTTLTVLRHPVERTLSYLRHHRDTTPGDRELPLEAIYEDPARFRPFIENHMVKMLSLRADEMTNGMMTVIDFDRGRLRRAKRALRKLDEFGLQEDLEGFAKRLEERFHWRLGPPVHSNVTEPVEVPESLRRRIADDNATGHGPLRVRAQASGQAGSPVTSGGHSPVVELEILPPRSIAVGRGNAFVIGGYCYHPDFRTRGALGARRWHEAARRAGSAAPRRRLRASDSGRPGGRPSPTGADSWRSSTWRRWSDPSGSRSS